MYSRSKLPFISKYSEKYKKIDLIIHISVTALCWLKNVRHVSNKCHILLCLKQS